MSIRVCAYNSSSILLIYSVRSREIRIDIDRFSISSILYRLHLKIYSTFRLYLIIEFYICKIAIYICSLFFIYLKNWYFQNLLIFPKFKKKCLHCSIFIMRCLLKLYIFYYFKLTFCVADGQLSIFPATDVSASPMLMLPETTIDLSRAQPHDSELAARYWRIFHRKTLPSRSKVKVFFSSIPFFRCRSCFLLLISADINTSMQTMNKDHLT